MKRIPDEMLRRMAQRLSDAERDEMAIPSYLHYNPLMRWMAWRRVEVIARHLQRICERYFQDDPPTVMDFGCGTGVLFETAGRYAGRIYGVDPFLAAAELLVSERGLENVVLLDPARAREVIDAGCIDIVLAAEVLEHVDPLEETLELFRSRMKPGGRLIVSVPTENSLYRIGRRLAGFRGDYHHNDAAAIDREIRGAGFRRIELEKVPAGGPLAIYWVAEYRLGDG